MKHLGDYDASTVIYDKFTTYRPSTGAAYTLGGTPALSVYKDNSTTQSTTGVTLTADFDSVTGLNHFAIDTSADGTFYSAGSFFQVVITTGTVDSVSVVGTVVASFTIRKDSALKPTTGGRTLDVSAGGEAGIDWANIGTPGSTVNFSATTVKTLTDAPSDSSGTTTLLSRVSSARAGYLDNLSAGAVALEATLTAMKGATFDGATDSLEALRNRGDSAWATATGFSTLDAAGVRTAVGLASANLDTQLADIPTVAEMNARTLAAASYATAAGVSAVEAKVDTVDTVADAIKVITDQITFTSANLVDVNIQAVNDVALQGNGTAGNAWRPA